LSISTVVLAGKVGRGRKVELVVRARKVHTRVKVDSPVPSTPLSGYHTAMPDRDVGGTEVQEEPVDLAGRAEPVVVEEM
jgi:hypothetical protein